jgi:hypothetical protein
MKTELTFFMQVEGGTNTTAHPIYANDFSIVVERESGQVFFRRKLSDKLTFVAEDFSWIMAQNFDAVIIVDIFRESDGTHLFHGKFVRTDCTINGIDGILSVTPTPMDEYDEILNALETEWDLAQLPIPTAAVNITIPPILQMYGIGDNFITNYWQGEVWEVEVEPITNQQTLTSMFFVEVLFTPSGQVTASAYCRVLHGTSGMGAVHDMYNVNNDVYQYATPFDKDAYGFDVVENSVFVNTPTIYGQVYDNQGQPTGQYYSIAVDPLYVYMPFQPRRWNSQRSLWLRVQKAKTTAIDTDQDVERLKSAYSIGDVIRALLAANNLPLTFSDVPQNSQILFGNPSPMTEWTAGWKLNFTAKSNIMKLRGDTVATKAPCTLATVFNFLRKALNIAWSVDGAQLKLEHITYYNNGGSYNTAETVGEDLTAILNPRNGKPWAFGQNQYQFEKYQMPEFVKWSWMDETDTIFDGSGFKCLSNYVNKGRTDENNVNNITTNIVKMMVQPDKFSLDGLAVILTYLGYKTDYYYFPREIGGDWRVINGQLSMWNLQETLLLYDAPCETIEVSGNVHNDVDYVRTKTNEVTYPANDADPQKLIKTNVGEGAVDTLTINIVNQSVKAKLKYGNE